MNFLLVIRVLCHFCREVSGECLQSDEKGYTFCCTKYGNIWRVEQQKASD
jgi:hypothetical protein